jgi:hypothetical protein
MQTNILQYLESIKFYSPFLGLTERLYNAINNARDNDLRQVQDDREQVEQMEAELGEMFPNIGEEIGGARIISVSDGFQAERETAKSPVQAQDIRGATGFFQASVFKHSPPNGRYMDEIIACIAGRDEGYPDFNLTAKSEIHSLQNLIAEEMYYILAFLARSDPARTGQPLPIKEVITSEIALLLGLPVQEPLIAELCVDFTGWLRDQGKVFTGWGNIIFAEGNRMYLNELPSSKDDDATTPERKYIHNSLSSRKRASNRKSSRGAGAS